MLKVTTINGRIVRHKETPADLILDSSYRSARLPMTITEDIRTATGNAIGIMETDMYPTNSTIRKKPIPLPAISSIYSQSVCITRTNSAMKKVTTNGGKKLFTNSPSSFLIYIWSFKRLTWQQIVAAKVTLLKKLMVAMNRFVNKPINCATDALFAFFLKTEHRDDVVLSNSFFINHFL